MTTKPICPEPGCSDDLGEVREEGGYTEEWWEARAIAVHRADKHPSIDEE